MRTDPSPSVTDTPLPADGKIRDRLGDDRHAFRRGLRRKLADQRGILDHVGERLAGLDVAFEAQKHRTDRVLDAAVGDDHVADVLGARRDRVPHAERLEHAARRRRDRRSPWVVAAAELGIGHRHRKIRPEPLAQREREREPGKAAAGDEHIRCLSVHHVVTSLPINSRNLTPLQRQPGISIAWSRCDHRLLTLPVRRGVLAPPRQTIIFVKDAGPPADDISRPGPRRHPRSRADRGESVSRPLAASRAGSGCSAAR